MYILFIDNDKLLAETCVKALSRSGYKTLWCQSAKEAIKQADKIHPSAIILEINLKNHNGIEFLYEFRSYPEWQNVPIIIYSWVPQKSLNLNPSVWAALNICEYIYKPTGTLKHLISTLGRHVPTVA